MLHDLLKQARIERSLSIDAVAKELDVTPEQVSRWEEGTEMPTSQQMANLTILYELPLKTLYAALRETDKAQEIHFRVRAVPKAGRIKLAIISQTAFLIVLSQIFSIPNAATLPFEMKLLYIYLPILATTMWMVYNQRYEQNPTQRKHNTKVELTYCLIQCSLTFLGTFFIPSIVAMFLLIISTSFYISTINPTRMNRPLQNR
ncbi:MAG: helix-turn-helix domain-containing protein [Peptococcaceae bacterium]|nr:helix-turn-helix domain-containing protein [Peptococcaceae bacterium]